MAEPDWNLLTTIAANAQRVREAQREADAATSAREAFARAPENVPILRKARELEDAERKAREALETTRDRALRDIGWKLP